MSMVYEKLKASDAVIVASPIYFGTVTAQLKAMVDRCHCIWVSKYVLKRDLLAEKKRKGIFLCVGGKDTREYFESAKKIVKMFFLTLGIDYSEDLFIGGMNTLPANSPDRKKALERAFEMGIALIKNNTLNPR